ncbi:MAG: FKBP-type peptidyl-prolyl cis-trans isomerase [Nitrososphaerota archaeon]|jgi:peptidylprolyl isomerase|nr:FKBP-type peptidyl-prolyl cis-trans isomerase [Nitrososphaerota archaeon]
MSFEKGTLLYVNYTAKVKDTGEAIESTVEDEAKKLNIYDPERRYEARLVSVGEDWVLKGLDEEIAKMEAGERKTVELSPEKAWGERDPTLLRMIPVRKFGEKADELRVGDAVEVDNRLGVVRFIGSGRAQVDFNHRLAGKTLVYDVEVVSKVETDEQKVRSLIKRRFPGELGDKIEFSQRAGDVTVEIPEEAFMVEGLQVIKRGISNDIIHFIPTVKKVTFKEVYGNKDAKAAPEEKVEDAAKPKEEPATNAEVEQKA